MIFTVTTCIWLWIVFLNSLSRTFKVYIWEGNKSRYIVLQNWSNYSVTRLFPKFINTQENKMECTAFRVRMVFFTEQGGGKEL